MAIMLAIPLLIDLAAIWSWRGSYRYAAMIPLPFLLLAYGVDVNSMIQGGNLTGLFTVLAGAPALLLLLIVSIVQTFAAPAAAAPTGRGRLSQRASLAILALLVVAVVGVLVLVLLPGG